MSIKDEGAEFDTFAGRYIWRRGGIIESRMGSKPRDPISIGVVAFQKPDFVLCHVGRVKPAVVWIVLYRVSLADAVAVDEVRGHKILRICAPGIAHRQRRVMPSSVLVFGVARLWGRWRGSTWHGAIERGLAPIAAGLVLAGGLAVLQAAGGAAVWAAAAVATGVLLRWPRLNPLILFGASGALFALVAAFPR